MHEDQPMWPKQIAMGFALALFASLATETGKWAVEALKKRIEKPPPEAK